MYKSIVSGNELSQELKDYQEQRLHNMFRDRSADAYKKTIVKKVMDTLSTPFNEDVLFNQYNDFIKTDADYELGKGNRPGKLVGLLFSQQIKLLPGVIQKIQENPQLKDSIEQAARFALATIKGIAAAQKYTPEEFDLKIKNINAFMDVLKNSQHPQMWQIYLNMKIELYQILRTHPEKKECVAQYEQIKKDLNAIKKGPLSAELEVVITRYKGEIAKITDFEKMWSPTMLAQTIARYRNKNFLQSPSGYVSPSPNDAIKINERDNASKALFPFDPNESHIQALRYVEATLKVYGDVNNYQHDTTSAEIAKKITAETYNAFEIYLLRNQTGHKLRRAENTLWLAEELAKTLKTHLQLDMTAARKAVTKARDVVALLKPAQNTITVTEWTSSTTTESQSTPKQHPMVTIEETQRYRVSKKYYDEFVEMKPWRRQLTKSTDGLLLDSFLTHHRDQLITLGSPTTPSARWLPLPANIKYEQINVGRQTAEEQFEPVHQSKFIRTGILTAYDVKDPAEQFRLAVKQLEEIFLNTITSAVEDYEKQYKDLIGNQQFEFYFDYKTLLSPYNIERHLGHKDNNGRFVKMAKDAMEVVQDRFKSGAYSQLIKIKIKANVVFTQTNAAINKAADAKSGYVMIRPLLQSSAVDNDTRHQKIDAVIHHMTALKSKTSAPTLQKKLDELIAIFTKQSTLKFHHEKIDVLNSVVAALKAGSFQLSQSIQNELAVRIEAAFHLQRLLQNNAPYHSFSLYQRNLMMVSLEHLIMGSQGLELVGCKSARDRTAVFAGAVKTMLENPATMQNWKLLDAGIIKSLQQGHHYRAMFDHVGIVKAEEVGSHFESEAYSEDKRMIAKVIKKLSKYLGAFEGSGEKKLHAYNKKHAKTFLELLIHNDDDLKPIAKHKEIISIFEKQLLPILIQYNQEHALHKNEPDAEEKFNLSIMNLKLALQEIMRQLPNLMAKQNSSLDDLVKKHPYLPVEKLVKSLATFFKKNPEILAAIVAEKKNLALSQENNIKKESVSSQPEHVQRKETASVAEEGDKENISSPHR